MAQNRKSADEGMENDLCDLDSNKICDNCCKCLEKDGTDYVDVSASFDVGSMRVYYGEDEDEPAADGLPPMDIDPALLAEWEEKLRLAELADGKDEMKDVPKHDPTHMQGRRKRRD